MERRGEQVGHFVSIVALKPTGIKKTPAKTSSNKRSSFASIKEEVDPTADLATEV